MIVLNTCTIREKPDTKFAAYMGNAAALKRAAPRHGDRRRRLLCGGPARAALLALPGRRRRVRPGNDLAPRRLARRRRRRRRPRHVGYRGRAALRGEAADASRARLPGMGADLDGVQLDVLVLHRPRGARPRGEPPSRRGARRGDAARAGRRPRADAARAERQLVGPRPAARHPHGVRRAPPRVRCGRGDRAHPLHEPAPEGLPPPGDRGDGRVRRSLRARAPAAAVRARHAS